MRDYQTKSNVGALPDTITATRFGSGEFNSIAVELENAVSTSDQSLAAADGTGEVSTQLAMALAIYGAGGAFYHADSGAVNAYVLTPISPKESPPAYFDGFTVIFEPGTPNTTASTVNVNSLGVKDITYSDGNALAGGELSGSCGIKYNLSDDRFELLFSSGSLAAIGPVYVVDSTQTDQGATSANADTYTLYDIATLVGTSKSATAYFPHNPVAGNQTNYVFDTSLDLSSYPALVLKIDNGSRLTRTTGDELLTLYSNLNLAIGNDQHITSVDILRFSSSEWPTVNPSWWGADRQETSVNTNAFNYAINSIYANGVVDISTGRYLFDGDIVITNKTIRMTGKGKNLTFLRWTSAGGINYDSTDILDQFHIDNMTLFTSAVSAGAAIDVNFPNTLSYTDQNCSIRNVNISYNSTNYWTWGIHIDDAWNTVIDNCIVLGNDGNTAIGIYMSGRSDSCVIQNCRVAHAENGIYVTGNVETAQLINNIVLASTNGITLAAASTHPGSQITNNHIVATQKGIWLNFRNQVTVNGNLIYGEGVDTQFLGIYIINATDWSNIFSNIILYTSGDSGSNVGIAHDTGDNCNFVNNIIVAMDTAISLGSGVDSIIVTGNNLVGSVTNDINDLGSTNCIIRNNTGYLTESSGTSAAIATGGTIAHGLSATPTVVNLTSTDTGVTAIYWSADATNITVNYTGGGSHAFHWEAKVR